jgi:hypothetical protein
MPRVRRWWLVSPLVLVATVITPLLACGSDGPGSARAGADPQPAARRVDPHQFINAGCAGGAAIPRVAFELGHVFHHLARNSPAVRCTVPHRRAEVASGPWRSVGYLSVLYGDCDASEGGCRLPLEVQNWPECAANPNSYKPNPGFSSKSAATDLNPSEPLVLHNAPWVPARTFEARTRIEIYAGETTVVVFATSARLAREAAETIASLVAASAPAAAAVRLRRSANQPGGGTACRTFARSSQQKGE